MSERPQSRYTRKKTWAALYNQHVNACYALLPHSGTHNSIDLIKCASPEETRATMRAFASHDNMFEQFYASKLSDEEAPKIERDKQSAIVVSERIRHAFVLARSSDYYHYHLFDFSDFRVLIVGQHDSYVQMTVWETGTNKIYKPAEAALALDSPAFLKARSTRFGHTIFLGALICGDKTAVAIRDNTSQIPPRTRRRILSEVHSIQTKRYRGRPLTFWDQSELEKHKRLTREGIQRSRLKNA